MAWLLQDAVDDQRTTHIQTKAEPCLLCLVWLVSLPRHLAAVVSFDIKGLGWGWVWPKWVGSETGPLPWQWHCRLFCSVSLLAVFSGGRADLYSLLASWVWSYGNTCARHALPCVSGSYSLIPYSLRTLGYRLFAAVALSASASADCTQESIGVKHVSKAFLSRPPDASVSVFYSEDFSLDCPNLQKPGAVWVKRQKHFTGACEHWLYPDLPHHIWDWIAFGTYSPVCLVSPAPDIVLGCACCATSLALNRPESTSLC